MTQVRTGVISFILSGIGNLYLSLQLLDLRLENTKYIIVMIDACQVVVHFGTDFNS